MRKYLLALIIFAACKNGFTQLPCAGEAFRQFDFWIGDWEVFAKNSKKAGDSKISLILDSCVVLEEWTSSSMAQGLRYAGKSFNTWNAATGNWQQTWVDNTGATTEYLEGKYADGKMTFLSRQFPYNKDTMAVRRLTFYKLPTGNVRQHGEISKNEGGNWATEYDLEYRRKK
jgi:hypothetical protein